MPTPRRFCEMKIPEGLVEKMESSPGGIHPILKRIERDFGLKTSSSYIGAKQFLIIGPNPEIIDLALETLQHRVFGREEKESDISGGLADNRAVWKLQGDYATKAGHLFLPELETLKNIRSVVIKVSSLTLEITCGFEDVEVVKTIVDKLQADIDGLYEEDIFIAGPYSEMVRMKKFVQRKQTYDRTVVCIWNERLRKITVFGKTDMNVRKAVDEWTLGKPFVSRETPVSPSPRALSREKTRSPARSPTRSPTRSLSPYGPPPSVDCRYKNELKIPAHIVNKLENNRGGIEHIIIRIEKEFGFKVVYARRKHFTLYGPHLDILEMALQTLVYRYVKPPPDNGVIGQLQGKNAVWRFIGGYAKKACHLFHKELNRLQKIKTVVVKATPSRMNPTLLEVLCSTRYIEIVKVEIEKLVGLVHHLFEKDIKIPDEVKEIEQIKVFIKDKHETDNDILCIFDEKSRQLSVYGRNEMIVWQAIVEVQDERKRELARRQMPKEYWNMYRQLYQVKIADELVEKLEQRPEGIMPIIQRIEKEYGVNTVYHRNKQMVLIGPSAEVLELAHETLESRYVTTAVADNVKLESRRTFHGNIDYGDFMKKGRPPQSRRKVVKFSSH